jgi:hypothetical protein
VVVSRDGGARSEHSVTLAWVDHDYWSGGRCPPSRVVEALFQVLTAHEDEWPIPPRFDAATARRRIPLLDSEMHARL